jgi:hypothetical protein
LPLLHTMASNQIAGISVAEWVRRGPWVLAALSGVALLFPLIAGWAIVLAMVFVIFLSHYTQSWSWRHVVFLTLGWLWIGALISHYVPGVWFFLAIVLLIYSGAQIWRARNLPSLQAVTTAPVTPGEEGSLEKEEADD